MTSSEENFLTSPANLTSLWGDPWGPVSYGTPRPIGGIGAEFNAGQIAGGAASFGTQGFMMGGPIGGAIGAAVGTAVGVISGIFTPNIPAQDTTTLVNGIEPVLKANLAAFMANPSPASQQQAEAVFMSYWNALTNGCAQFGGAGTACVNDRSPGGKWDWWAYYYYPIANYKGTVSTSPGAQTVANASGQQGQTVPTSIPVAASGIDMNSILILGALAIAGMMMFGGHK